MEIYNDFDIAYYEYVNECITNNIKPLAKSEWFEGIKNN